MNLAPPTAFELRDLVEAALRYRDAAPWRTVADDQIFGVFDRERGEIVYLSILGQGGLVRGLTLFPGTQGLLTLDLIQFELLPTDPDEGLLRMRSIGCMFVPASMATPDDRKVVRDSGVACGRAKLLPQFVSYEPGYAPWTVSGAEARLLTTCLDQALVVARELAADPDLLEENSPRQHLVRVPAGALGEEEWMSQWRSRPLTRDVRPPALDEVTLARLAQLPREPMAEWEVDAFTGLGVIAESRTTRPRVLRTLMLLDRTSGFIHAAEPIEAPELEASVTDRFVRQALRVGHSPRRILVRDYTLRCLLAPAARAMGCKLLRLGHLPGIEAARADMLAHASPARCR
jgi:hypothetical protein